MIEVNRANPIYKSSSGVSTFETLADLYASVPGAEEGSVWELDTGDTDADCAGVYKAAAPHGLYPHPIQGNFPINANTMEFVGAGSATPNAGGAGYDVGDILYDNSSTATIPCSFVVDAIDGSGGVTSVSLLDEGQGYTKWAANPISTTTDSVAGTSCTLDILMATDYFTSGKIGLLEYPSRANVELQANYLYFYAVGGGATVLYLPLKVEHPLKFHSVGWHAEAVFSAAAGQFPGLWGYLNVDNGLGSEIGVGDNIGCGFSYNTYLRKVITGYEGGVPTYYFNETANDADIANHRGLIQLNRATGTQNIIFTMLVNESSTATTNPVAFTTGIDMSADTPWSLSYVIGGSAGTSDVKIHSIHADWMVGMVPT